MLGRHQCCEHFDLQRRDVREETHTVADTALMGFQNVQNIADQVERTLVNPLAAEDNLVRVYPCLLYTSPSPRDGLLSRMPSSA